jgi:hypothetical protein
MKFALACLLSLCLQIPVTTFSQDLLIAVKKDGKWGYVNTSGASVIPGRFDEAYPFFGSRAIAVEKKQYGIIDAKGKWISGPRKGQVLGEIRTNRLVCSDDLGKWGALNMKGEIALPFENDIMSSFQNAWVLAGTKTSTQGLYRAAVLDTAGKVVVNFDNTYLTGKSFAAGKKVREGYVTVLVDGDFAASLLPSNEKLDGRTLYYALLDVKSKRLVSLKVASLDAEVREGRFNLVIDGIAYSWSQPLPAEPVVSEAKFSFLTPAIYPFSAGIAAIQKDGKWAYIDKDGSLLSESNLSTTDYTNDKPLYTGGFVILWKKSGQGIYVDLKGNQRIPLEFEELNPFQGAAAVVKYQGKYGLIQKDGTWVLPAEYEGVRF